MKLIGHFELSENDQVAALPNKDMYNKSCKIHKWRIATPVRTWKFINESLDEMKAWIHAVSKVINPNYTFGMPLSRIVEREEKSAISTIRVPMIVQRCIQFLRENGMTLSIFIFNYFISNNSIQTRRSGCRRNF